MSVTTNKSDAKLYSYKEGISLLRKIQYLEELVDGTDIIHQLLEGSTCVNASIPDGPEIKTQNHDSLDHNLDLVIAWVKEQKKK